MEDARDFWRVETYESDPRLLFRPEMKPPGRAWLGFKVEPHPAGAMIPQTAIFEPGRLPGPADRYLAYPLHRMVFSPILDKIAHAAIARGHPIDTEAR